MTAKQPKRVIAFAGHLGTIVKRDNFTAMSLVKWDNNDQPLWQFNVDLTPFSTEGAE